MYDNMHRVQNQEILKLSPDSKLVIDEHGKATLRVRIEEVSKNHQKQVRHATGRDATAHAARADPKPKRGYCSYTYTPDPTYMGEESCNVRRQTNSAATTYIHACMHEQERADWRER